MLPRNCLGLPPRTLSRKCPCFLRRERSIAERRDGETYRASIDVNRPAFALFKMTWHANWKAYVDGKPETTAMLSPGFIGVSVPAGHHEILMRYQPESHKGLWGFAGLARPFCCLFAGERRGVTGTLGAMENSRRIRACSSGGLGIAAGLTLLALPGVCSSVHQRAFLWGHDGFVYFPAFDRDPSEHPSRKPAAPLGARPRTWHRPTAVPVPSADDLLLR